MNRPRPLPSVSTRPIPGPAGRLSVDDGGDGGLPVLFLHSLAGRAAHWTPQLTHLRRERRAVALELRGHGDSDPPADGDYSIGGYCDDVTAGADALGLDRFVLVGHSMGAAGAAAYAAENPDRVAGVALIDGTFAREQPTPSYAGPTTLVLSDVGDNPSAAHHHVADLPHAVIHGTGHWLQLDRPDELNARLDAFLAQGPA